jgi:catechol 2,3-dioxygenase-like lactoylglutathione lyase family enzyme
MIETRIDGRLVDRLPAETIAARGWGAGVLWVDAVAPSEDELEYLVHAFDIHPLAEEDIRHRNQRPKVDEYGDQLFIVVFGASDTSSGTIQLRELHILAGASSVLSISDSPVPHVSAVGARCQLRPELAAGEAGKVVYRLIDAAVDSFIPVIDHLEEQINALETRILERPDSALVGDIFDFKRDLTVIRRLLAPQRDLLQGLAGAHGPTLGVDAQLYLRDVYDHAVRLVARHRDRSSRRLPLVAVQPARRADAQAVGRGHDLPAADVLHRVLRPELRVPRRQDQHDRGVLGRHRDRGRLRRGHLAHDPLAQRARPPRPANPRAPAARTVAAHAVETSARRPGRAGGAGRACGRDGILGRMSLTGLHHVQINVPDVSAAVAFYELLGMRRRPDRPDIGVDGAWLDVGEQQIHLIEAQVPSDLGQHFALEVDDLDAMIASLRDRGVEVREPSPLGEGLPRQTSIHDPAGNRIELREPPRG